MEFVWKTIRSLFGRQLPFTDCLVANFSSDILGSNFIFKYFLVDFFLGRFVHQIYFGWGFFGKLFCRVCGRNVFSHTFWVEISAGICLA